MYILCNIFKNSCESLKKLYTDNNNYQFLEWFKVLNVEPSPELEKELQSLVNLMVGFSFDGKYNYSEVKVCFDNVVRNMSYNSYKDVFTIIQDYKNHYTKLFEDNHLVDLFVKVIKKIYSHNYNGKLGNEYSPGLASMNDNSTYIGVYNNTITIGQYTRIDKESVPYVQIHDAYSCEQVLRDFIQTIRESNCAYNVFALPGFVQAYNEDEIISMLFEGVILNASSYELSHVDDFFRKYISIIEDPIMPSLNRLVPLGQEFNDEVYFKTKRSDIEYETPWYFAFMLKDHRYELPNVRLGLTPIGDKTVANIIAIQNSQISGYNPEVSQMIKVKTPKKSSFRFYNPDHFVSLVLTIGMLNGMGITDINVQDFMPIRYRKTVLDKAMNEEEAENYIQRVYDKNIACYFKLATLSDDIMISNYPSMGDNLMVKTNDTVHFNNEFLDNLYLMAYNYAKSLDIFSLQR